MKEIVLVDDDAVNNYVNKELIKKRYPDAKIMSFENPLFAINYLSDERSSAPDIVLLDLNMPLINGWEFMEQLQEQNTKVNIAILTSSINPLDIEKSKDYRMVSAFLIKPINLDKLEELLVVK